MQSVTEEELEKLISKMSSSTHQHGVHDMDTTPKVLSDNPIMNENAHEQ